MILFALIIILFSIAILLISFFIHDTKYDKLLVLNSLSTHTVALIGFFAASNDTHVILDISIAYVCIGFITNIAIFNFFNKNTENKKQL